MQMRGPMIKTILKNKEMDRQNMVQALKRRNESLGYDSKKISEYSRVSSPRSRAKPATTLRGTLCLRKNSLHRYLNNQYFKTPSLLLARTPAAPLDSRVDPSMDPAALRLHAPYTLLPTNTRAALPSVLPSSPKRVRLAAPSSNLQLRMPPRGQQPKYPPQTRRYPLRQYLVQNNGAIAVVQDPFGPMRFLSP